MVATEPARGARHLPGPLPEGEQGLARVAALPVGHARGVPERYRECARHEPRRLLHSPQAPCRELARTRPQGHQPTLRLVLSHQRVLSLLLFCPPFISFLFLSFLCLSSFLHQVPSRTSSAQCSGVVFRILLLNSREFIPLRIFPGIFQLGNKLNSHFI